MNSTRPLLRAALVVCAYLPALAVVADPFLAPGRPDLGTDLRLLADAGLIDRPVSTWPISWSDLLAGLDEAAPASLDAPVLEALGRMREEERAATVAKRILPHIGLGLANDARAIRTFADSPRERSELELGFAWTGDRLAYNVNVVHVSDVAESEWRLDGSYAALALGNWALVAGFPERWWGPGVESSLILSTNARPLPQVGIQRIESRPFEARWLRWVGPWTLVSFLGEFDDDRVIDNALLFGLRLSAKPLPRLEIGFSRTAQFCGSGRICGLSTFENVLLGRDNRGVNVSASDEPGNQLAGFDIRWALPQRPYALYMQWIGEDSRQGGPQIGSFLRLFGGEYWSALRWSGWQQRTHLEVADTVCQEGAAGFGGAKYNCAYQHSIYKAGYRYEGRPLGHSADTDSRATSITSFVNGPRGRDWSFAVRHVRINRGPVSGQPHAISMTPADYSEIEVAHGRALPIGTLRFRLGLIRLEDEVTGVVDDDATVSVQWWIGY